MRFLNESHTYTSPISTVYNLRTVLLRFKNSTNFNKWISQATTYVIFYHFFSQKYKHIHIAIYLRSNAYIRT